MSKTKEELGKRDYIVLIDKSGSMGQKLPNGQTRWEGAKEMTQALVAKCAQFDADGVTLIPFSTNHKKYDNVKDAVSDLNRIFDPSENEPSGSTNLHGALETAFNVYLNNTNAETRKPITILCITDGEPDAPQDKVAKLIVETTKKMNTDEEIGVSFIQVGNDSKARDYLKGLDDDLQKQGAKFDIVDTKTFEEIETMTLTDVLVAAIDD